jgi:hypothetical protein
MMAHSRLLFTSHLLLFAGTLVIVGVVAWRWYSHQSPPKLDGSKLRDLEMEVLEERYLPVKVCNLGSKSLRIVGVRGTVCEPGGCIFAIKPDTLQLAPGETKEVLVHYKGPPVAGPFQKELIIYSATNTLNEHKLKVTGVAVAAKKKDVHHQDTKDTKENAEEKSHVSEQDSE